MKTILFTGYDEPYAPLEAITTPRMFKYARRHGIGFIAYDEPPPGLNIYWTGLARGLELLRGGYDRIIYLDVDQLITNMDRPPTCLHEDGFYCSKDWGEDAMEPWHFSACGWIAHRDSIKMFEEVLSMEPEWRDKPFQEQGPWQAWARRLLDGLILVPNKPEIRSGYFNVWPRRTFNAVPDQVCPGKVPEPWQPGDFAAHITMVDLPRRIEIAKEILAAL